MKILSFCLYAVIVVLKLNFIEGVTDQCEDNKAGENQVQLQKDNSTYIIAASYANSTCSWHITAPPGYIVVVEFSLNSFRFSVDNCEKENFKIYDGNSTSDNLVATYCAAQKPGTFVHLYLTGVNGLLILKQDDPPSPKKQFSLYAEKKKQGSCHNGKVLKLAASSAVSNFTSPNYPYPCPPGSSDKWVIEAPPGKYVKLDFVDVSNNFCKGTTLNVFDGDSDNSKELIRKICCKKIYGFWCPKITVFSKGQKLFVSSESLPYIQYPYNNKGFQIFYTAVDEVTSCGARRGDAVIKLKGDNGTIHSPNYPSSHPSNLTCRWDITAAPGQVIEITSATSAFRDDCSKQWVRIYDGSTTSNPVLTKLCSYKSSKSLFSSTNHIVVEFVTTGTTKSKGFLVSYKARNANPKPYACLDSEKRQIKDATSGKIASQRYPLLYSNNAQCFFDIQVPIGYFLYLTFTTFDLGSSGGDECTKDYVHIKSVTVFGSRDWKKSAVLCGRKDTPFSYISPTNKVSVHFESDGTGQHPGFEATYQRIKNLPLSTSCGQNSLKQKIQSSSGTIASYEYPLKYQNNVQCRWVITTSSSLYEFKIKFDDMNIEPSPGCKDDYVQIRDGDSNTGDSLGKFCGSTKPDSFKSSESSIFVEFKTNGTGRYGGFKLSYEETYNWKGILLIAVCTIVGIVVLVGLVVFVVRKFCCLKDKYSGIETVDMKPAVS